METNLQHEDLLIKLRAKLNEEKIKLWEPPYFQQDDDVSPSLQELSRRYSELLSTGVDTVLEALRELQLHSLDRSKANAEFKETGFATFRVKATLPGEKPRVMKIQRKLDVMGSELIAVVGQELGVVESRVKLIFNGKVIKPTPSLEEQCVKNGAQIMALVMAETPEQVKKEDTMYMEMKSTRDDAQLLSECVDDLGDDDEYLKLEDQSGCAVELPAWERRALVVGLALHARGRTAAAKRDYPLALLLMLEADRQFSECRSTLLKSVDNPAVLQLDIAWCYLCLQSLSAASDAAARLRRAEEAFKASYGEQQQRLIALKGTAANERVLIMRLYLLQGIVAYHQNKRAEAKTLLDKAEVELNALRVSWGVACYIIVAANERVLIMRLYLLQGIVAYHQNKRAEAKTLLDKAEVELNALRVNESSVVSLMELGWSRGAARAGLRAAGGDLDAAHHYLAEKRAKRDTARDKHRQERQLRLLGLCADGSPVSAALVQSLVGMGYARALAVLALRNANNHASEAVRLIQEQPELLMDSDLEEEEETDTPSSDDSTVEPDEKMVSELEAMGYLSEQASAALRLARNSLSEAVEMLVAANGVIKEAENGARPSTSSGVVSKKPRKHKKKSKSKEKRRAWERLSSTIRGEEDEHLDTDLQQEQDYLAQYRSLL